MGVHFLGLAASRGIQILGFRTGSSVGVGEDGVVNILSSYFLEKFSKPSMLLNLAINYSDVKFSRLTIVY